MSGLLLNLIPKRTYDFSALISGNSETLFIAERIDASQHSNSSLIVRVHTASCAGGTITFNTFKDGFTTDDPATKFFAATGAPPLTINNSTVAPTLLAVTGNAFVGHYVALSIVGSRTTVGSISATVSVDLCLRSADDTDLATVQREYPLFRATG